MEGRYNIQDLPVIYYELRKHGKDDKFGFAITQRRYKNTGLYRVEKVVQGSIASQINIRQGFCIIEVNDQNVSDMSKNEIMQMLTTSVDTLSLLVAHPEVCKHYRKRGIHIGTHLKSLVHLTNAFPGRDRDHRRINHINLMNGVNNDDVDLDLQGAYEGGIINPSAPFECQICLQQINPQDGVVLKECLHEFCRNCLTMVVANTEDPVCQCPYVQEYDCEQELLQHEIKELVPQPTFNSFIGKNIKAARNSEMSSFQCRTAGCDGWLIYHPGEMDTYICTECGQVNCLVCQAQHGDISCHEFQVMMAEGRVMGVAAGESGERVEVDPHGLEKLEQVYDGGIARPSERFDCPICFTETEPNDGIILKNCLHQFCRECLAEHVGHSEDAAIKCPYAGDYTCDVEISQHEMAELVRPDVYDKYMDRTVRVAEGTMTDAFHCKTPDCPGFWVVDPGVNNYQCEVCNQNNCINCKAVHGVNVNCEDFQIASDSTKANQLSEEAVDKLIGEGRAQRCPNCRHVIQKHGGCPNMTCTRCGKGFRWTGIDC